MSANPHANGGLLRKDLKLPDFRDYAVDVPQPGRCVHENTSRWASSCATSCATT
jgi:xylulose-5-phosphate/fructose-6-phosphate phosphoketolase